MINLERFNANTTNYIILKILPAFFLIIFISATSSLFTYYLNHNAWVIGDWLINYQSGFIRRGLTGEIIYTISSYTTLNPGQAAFIMISTIYGVFLLFSYLTLKNKKNILPYTLLIFSPIVFIFPINDPGGGQRKEIIYFALLAIAVWSTHLKNEKLFDSILLVIIGVYPLAILSHEMLAIFLPVLLSVYLIRANLNTKKIVILLILLAASILAFIFSIYKTASTDDTIKIFSSLAKQGYSVKGGAIGWLDKDFKYGIKAVSRLIKNTQIFPIEFLTIIIFLAAISFIPLGKKIKVLFENRIILALIIISSIGMFAVYLTAIDWGRWIHIQVVSLFFLTLAVSKQSNNDDSKEKLEQTSISILSLVFLLWYSLFWIVPHGLHAKQDIIIRDYKKTYIFKVYQPIKRVLINK